MLYTNGNFKKFAWLLPVTAGSCWGLLAFFFHYLEAAGFNALQATAVRLFLAALILGAIMLKKDPALFRFQIKNCWCFGMIGIGGLLLANYCYFTAISYTTIPVAAVLLYSAPIYVTLLSIFLFGEKLGLQGVIALILISLGCLCVSGVFGGAQEVTAKGLLYGIGAGLIFSCFGIGSKYASRFGYSSYTTSFYTFVFGFLASLPFSQPAAMVGLFTPRILLLFIAFALVCAVIPYFIYNLSLRYLRAGEAAILATAEPVVACLVGIFIFSQDFNGFVLLGIVFVVLGIIVLNMKLPVLTKKVHPAAEKH